MFSLNGRGHHVQAALNRNGCEPSKGQSRLWRWRVSQPMDRGLFTGRNKEFFLAANIRNKASYLPKVYQHELVTG